MKILIVGAGSPIPPTGWGAVEAIIWEYMKILPKIGVEVELYNYFPLYADIPNTIVQLNKSKGPFDCVHFHYDLHYAQAELTGIHLPVAMTSHFPWIGVENIYQYYNWYNILNYITSPLHQNFNFVLSKKSQNYFLSKGANANLMGMFLNGASHQMNFTEQPKFPDKTLYLGKITQRKGQDRYGSFDCIDFVGNTDHIEQTNIRTDNLKNYLGPWTREQVDGCCTDYANLALLSLGEESPLVVREALIAGLGLVISECSTEGLDLTLPFIHVIPDAKLLDLPYVEAVLAENRRISRSMRKEIRQYGLENFTWEASAKQYVNEMKKLLIYRNNMPATYS